MILYLFFSLTAILACLTYFVKNRIVSHGLVFLYLLIMAGLGLYLLPRVGNQLNQFFFCDAIGMIFYIILVIVSLVSAIHYIEFVRDRDVRPGVQAMHNAGTIFF